MPLIPDRTVDSPNRYARWRFGQPRAVLIHSTRSGRSGFTDAQELRATLSWFQNPESRASAHWVIDASGAKIRVVPDEHPAWHAGEHNQHAYGIELTQSALGGPYTDGHYGGLVAVCAEYVRLGVPIVRIPTFRNGDRGFAGHEDSLQGRRIGKSDPGPPFDWERFLRLLREEVEHDMSAIDDLRRELAGLFIAIDDTRTVLALVGRHSRENRALLRAAFDDHLALKRRVVEHLAGHGEEPRLPEAAAAAELEAR